VVFVEQSRPAGELIRRNLEGLGVKSGYRILSGAIAPSLIQLPDAFDYVYLDPPYRLEHEYGTTLKLLANSRLLNPGATVIAEHSSKYDPDPRYAGLERYRKLEQGDAALSFYRVPSAGS
jgi:16S rRNA (guanine966-N2)-methyltransferase